MAALDSSRLSNHLGARRRVKSVSDGVLTVQRNGKEEALPFGTCVWATGIAMHPLVRPHLAAARCDTAASLPACLSACLPACLPARLRFRGPTGCSQP